MKINQPLISILICNYNYSKYIEEALSSAVNQDYKNIEIVIIDDGSKDESVKVIKTFIRDHSQSVIKLNAKGKNQGLCYARNDAINVAEGEYFVFLDSDDTMPSDYISKLYDVAIKEGADIVYGDVRRFGDANSESNESEYSPEKLLLHNYINISSLVKKSAIKNHRFDVKLNRKTLEDYDFWLGLSLAGCKFAKSRDTYLNYRIQSASRNKNTESLRDQALGFIDIWSYIVDKYRTRYPDKINADTYLSQLRRYIEMFGSELATLNHEVHSELIPELKKRHEHINSQNKQINHLIARRIELEGALDDLRKSREYVLGYKLLAISRRLRNIGKR